MDVICKEVFLARVRPNYFNQASKHWKMNKRVGLPQPSLLQGRKSNFWIFLATTTTAAAAASSVKILGFKIVIVCQNCLDSFMERARASEQQANSDFSIISYTLSDVVWYSIFEYVHGHYFLLAQSTWDPMSGCFCRLLNISIVQGIEQILWRSFGFK